MSPDYSYEWPADPNCPSCDGRGWFAEPDRTHPDGDLIDVRCPCYHRHAILTGPPELGMVNDDWTLGPHRHRWVTTPYRTYCYWCHEPPA